MHRIGQRLAAIVIVSAALVSGDGDALAAEVDHAKQYSACIALIYRTPDKAYESAMAWEKQGGGASARHCAALALFERGLRTEAAERLEALAAELPKDSRVSPAELLAQAGNIWLLEGDLERAKRDISAAAKMAPENASVQVDQARIAAEEGAYAEALSALDRAIVLAPGDDDAHVFRAAALRHLGRIDAAAGAIEEAMRLNRDNPSTWLERGLIRLDQGNPAGAKQDWQETIKRFDGTPAAEVAEARLEALKQTTQ